MSSGIKYFLTVLKYPLTKSTIHYIVVTNNRGEKKMAEKKGGTVLLVVTIVLGILTIIMWAIILVRLILK